MSAVLVIRDVRRAGGAGALEVTLSDGRVFYLACLGAHDQERDWVRETLLPALAASGITVMPS